MFPCLEGRCGRCRPGCVPAEFDICLCCLDVINHRAKLMYEPYQGHIYMLTNGLAGYGKVTVEGVIVSFAEVMKRKCTGGVLGSVHRFFHYHCIYTKCF